MVVRQQAESMHAEPCQGQCVCVCVCVCAAVGAPAEDGEGESDDRAVERPAVAVCCFAVGRHMLWVLLHHHQVVRPRNMVRHGQRLATATHHGQDGGGASPCGTGQAHDDVVQHEAGGDKHQRWW